MFDLAPGSPFSGIMIKELPLPFTLHLPFLDRDITGISTFSIMLVIAFITASYLIPRELARRGLKSEVADTAILIAVLGTIIGAKIGFVFEVWHEIWVVDTDWKETLYYILAYRKGMGEKLPGQAYGLWEALFSGGGLVFYGGFIAGFGGLYYYLRKHRLDIWTYGDAFIPSMAIGYAIGRLGCMISGDGCYGHGASIDIPIFTMIYGPLSVISSHGVNVWNTPVMESLVSFLLFAWMMRKGRYMSFKPGMLVAVFFVVNGVARFLVEFIRLNDAAIPILDPPMIEVTAGKFVPLSYETAIQAGAGGAYYFQHWHWYGFTQSQIVGFFLIVIGLAWIYTKKLYRTNKA